MFHTCNETLHQLCFKRTLEFSVTCPSEKYESFGNGYILCLISSKPHSLVWTYESEFMRLETQIFCGIADLGWDVVSMISFSHILSNISNTRKSISSGYPNTEKWVEKTRHSRVFFDRLRAVWIPDETLFWVFDMASHTIHNSWRNSKQKLAKFYAN